MMMIYVSLPNLDAIHTVGRYIYSTIEVTAVYEPDSYFVNEADGTVQACVSIISGSPNPSTLSSSSSVVVTFLSGGSASKLTTLASLQLNSLILHTQHKE